MAHPWHDIPAGEEAPREIHAVVEIPKGSKVKYELDKESGAMMVDRFLHTAMFYPANYGFIPNTLSDDGDPADILVITGSGVVPGAVIPSRPIGVVHLEDEAGMDEKIIAVPVEKLHPYYAGIKSYRDLPEILIQQIAVSYTHLTLPTTPYV